MKKLILITALFIGLFSFAQDSTAIKITEAERIIDKYGGAAVDKFNNAVDTITPFAKDGFKIVTKLKFAEGVVYLLVFPFCILFWFIFNHYYNKACIEDSYWIDTKAGPLSITFLILSIGSTIGLIPALYHGLTHVIAPEWFAIKEIANLF